MAGDEPQLNFVRATSCVTSNGMVFFFSQVVDLSVRGRSIRSPWAITFAIDFKRAADKPKKIKTYTA
jgi:hypothetical protein